MRSMYDVRDNLGYMRRTIEVLSTFGVEPSKEMNAVVNTLKWVMNEGQVPEAVAKDVKPPPTVKDVNCIHGKAMSKCSVCGSQKPVTTKAPTPPRPAEDHY